MATFMELYHPTVLNNLLASDPSGELLMGRFFNDAHMSMVTGNRGLIYWLLNERMQPYTKHTPTGPRTVRVPVFGLAGEVNQRGILCKNEGCYNYNGRERAPISRDEAIACAKETLDVINQICAFIDDDVVKGVALDAAWYGRLNNKIMQVCQGQAHTPLWYGVTGEAQLTYQLRPYLMKYFHIMYPEIFAGFYSRTQIKNVLALLGIVPATELSLTERNGLITLKMKALIPTNPSGIKFAKALYPYFIQLGRTSGATSAAAGRGMAGVDGNGKPTGRVSSKMQRTATYDSDPQLVLTVKADFMADCKHDLYLRYISYGNYTGDDWLKGPVYKGSAPYNAYFLTRDAMKAKGHSSHNIEVKLEPSVVEFLYPCFAYINADVVNDVKIPGDIGPEHTYSLDIIPYENPCGYSATNVAEEQKYRKFVHKHYLDVPESTQKTIEDIVSRLDWKPRMDFWELICMVCGYFRNSFVYSYNFDYSADEDVVGAFLNSGKKYDDGFGRGICNHFSSAATLIFRALGLPARKTSGFVCGHNGSNTIPVTTNNCHGWVEVYKDGLGWVIVDPTASVKQDPVP